MKKVVLKLDLPDDKAKQKALKTVSTLSGQGISVPQGLHAFHLRTFLCKIVSIRVCFPVHVDKGIDAISMDMKEKKLTVIGTVDPVNVASKLRKYWQTNIVSVGPAKEPEKKKEPKTEEAKKEEEKKEEPKKEEAKKEEAKKNEPKKEEEKKEEEKKEGKKEEEQKKEPAPAPDPVLELVRAYRAYNPHMTTYYYVQSMEENPNACVIC